MAGRIILLAVCFAWAFSQRGLVRAEDAPASNPPAKEVPAKASHAEAAPAVETALATQQQQVLERYSELEKKLLRMAELTAGTDPHRAALLRKAVAQSKQQGIEAQLAQLVELLGQERLAPAVNNQAAVEQDLTKLLQLLLSEDRSKRLQSEKERIQKYIQRVNQLIKQQKQLQGQAAEGDMQQIAESQAKLAEKTGELARDLGAEQESEKKENKPGGAKSSDAQGSDDEKSDGKSGDNKSGDKPKPTERKPARSADGGGEKNPYQPPDGKPGEGPPGDRTPEQKPGGAEPGQETPGDDKPAGEKSADEKSGEEKPGQSGGSKSADGQDSSGGSESEKKPGGKPKAGQGSPGQPGEPSDGKAPQGDTKPDDESPDQGDSGSTRRRVAQAEQKMREAERKLADAQRKQAIEKQEQAKRELELAKAELEAILRQLREEEIGRTLAMLESRFRKMLDMQNQVNTGTKRLDKVPADQRDHDDEIEAGRLSRQEALIVDEANKALAVLHDEGSAVAFPEAVSDLRDDMEQVVVRLAQAKVDVMTQGLEDDIVVSLEEMIAAFHKAQKQVEAKGSHAGGEQESPLVDTLAEIKMIRSMQTWVNGRTRRFTEMSKTDQADTPELIAALRKLAEREDRIHRAARDIVVGRNK